MNTPTTARPLTYAELARAVEYLAARSFADAEDYIDELPALVADDDAKAALWLLAWSYAEPASQRAHALELLAELRRPTLTLAP